MPTTPAPTKRLVLGPLTTSASYPSSCSAVIQPCLFCSAAAASIASSQSAGQTATPLLTAGIYAGAWQGQQCTVASGNIGFGDSTDCWPARANDSISTPSPLQGWGVYSPGLLCPTGYATACSATGTSVAGFGFQFAPSASETAIGCCPSGYTCSYVSGQTTDGQTCYSRASIGSYPVFSCSSGTRYGDRFQTVPTTITTTSSNVVVAYSVSTALLYAPMFQLLRRASDLPASTSVDTATPTGSAASESSGSGLSSGAIAGLVVGIVAGVAVLAGIGLFFFIRHHRKTAAFAQVPVQDPPPPPPSSSEMAMGTSSYADTPKPATELPSDRSAQVYEMSTARPAELPAYAQGYAQGQSYAQGQGMRYELG